MRELEDACPNAASAEGFVMALVLGYTPAPALSPRNRASRISILRATRNHPFVATA